MQTLRYFIISSIAVFVLTLSSLGQNSNDAFKASKGTWRFPITNVHSVDTTMMGCLGDRFNGPYLTLKAGCSQDVKAIQPGEVSAAADIEGTYMIMIKTGEYFLVYYGLSETHLKKGDLVQQGSTIGTLAKGDDEETYDLTLSLLNTNGFLININRWFDWTALHSNSLVP